MVGSFTGAVASKKVTEAHIWWALCAMVLARLTVKKTF